MTRCKSVALFFWFASLFGVSEVVAQTSFVVSYLPSNVQKIPILYRGALAEPARYRLIFLPGSGCSGMQGVAERYFRGALHAEVFVLHKPYVDLEGSTPSICSDEFTQWDALSAWAEVARFALKADVFSSSSLPVLLVGASEGAEILVNLSDVVPNLRGLVMISSSGLDPRKTLELQAARLCADAALRELAAVIDSNAAGSVVYQGRTLRYWRDLWKWEVTRPLLDSPVSVVQIWGDADALIPNVAYSRFADLIVAEGSARAICSRRLYAVDHGLQSEDQDGIQWLWARIENWARKPREELCDEF